MVHCKFLAMSDSISFNAFFAPKKVFKFTKIKSFGRILINMALITNNCYKLLTFC